MNTLIIHGDNTQKSYERYRQALQKAKEKGWEIETSLDNIRKQSLFTAKRAAIIYFDKALNIRDLKKLPKESKIEEFKLPKLIFTFLESFFPKNTKKCMELFRQVTKTEPSEFIFSLLVKQIRDLYWLRVDAKSLAYPSWRIAKLRNQSAKFTADLLKILISDMSEIDIEVKTSKANFVDSLDLLIIGKLQ